jgi:anti-repressor protein
MNELISINYNSEQPTVLGRDLHEALEVQTPYDKWFPRMCEYGFEEQKDYSTFLSDRSDGKAGKPRTNHQLTIPMAKEICMLQRSDKGREFRQYFIQIEEQWNTPDAVMARALNFANQKLAEIQQSNLKLTEKVAIQEQQIIEMQPKVTYYDIVLNCKDLVTITTIAKDYGKSGQWMNETLHELGIQYKQGKIWLLYQKHAEQGYTSTKTSIYDGTDGEKHTSVHTYWTQKGRLFIYDTLKANGILPLIECSED